MNRSPVKITVLLAATTLFLVAASAQPTQSHPLSEIFPTDTDLNMNGYAIGNISQVTLDEGGGSEGLVLDDLTLTHENRVQSLVIDPQNDELRIEGGNLDVNDNNITGFFSPPCNTGNVSVGIRDDGKFYCTDTTGEVQNDFVNRGGDSMTGVLDMRSNSIIDIGSGNITIGDGSGDVNMDGNRIYDSSLGHFQSAGVSDTLSNTQNNLDTLGPNSLYVADDVSVGGDFIGTGGDVAENIKTENDRELEPGTVTTISGDLEVKASTEKRDTGVAGIVSTDPGVKLAKERDGVPLALSGIVPVKATAENGEIEPGDLLTTSSEKGYAMKCQDSVECHGAILGKAMGSLDEKGKVETLVTLG